MSYLPDGLPGPNPTIDDAPFWDYCNKGELRFQRCRKCGRWRHPPAAGCTRCKQFDKEWVAAPDEAELFSYSIIHSPAHPSLKETVPYNLAMVLYRSCDNIRMTSNIVDCKPEDIRIGMKLALVWEKAGNGMMLPRYKRKD